MRILVLAVLSVSFVSSVSLADDMSVEVTSFVAAGLRTRGAELCGKVKNMSEPWVVAKVKVDANHKDPAYYTALVGSEGKFCVSVISNGGKAEVSLASLSGEALAPHVESQFLSKGRK